MKELIQNTSIVLVGLVMFAFLAVILSDILKHHKSCKAVDRDEIIRKAAMMPLASWEIVCSVEEISPFMKEVVVECKIDEFEMIAVGKTFNGKLSSVYEIEIKPHY